MSVRGDPEINAALWSEAREVADLAGEQPEVASGQISVGEGSYVAGFWHGLLLSGRSPEVAAMLREFFGDGDYPTLYSVHREDQWLAAWEEFAQHVRERSGENRP